MFKNAKFLIAAAFVLLSGCYGPTLLSKPTTTQSISSINKMPNKSIALYKTLNKKERLLALGKSFGYTCGGIIFLNNMALIYDHYELLFPASSIEKAELAATAALSGLGSSICAYKALNNLYIAIKGKQKAN